VFEPFFLLPGRIMWTKNIELGIAAFKEFCRTSGSSQFRLVIAGMVDAKSEGYFAQLRHLAADNARIEFRIAPGDEEMADLYRTCYGVLFTAFNEDWGLVPLEAMSFAKPVIATDSGGPRESVTPQTGFLEPPDPSSFARRMHELASDPLLAREMGRAGRARARLFSWDHYVRRIDDVLEQLCPAVEASPHAFINSGPPALGLARKERSDEANSLSC
jgi:glycosyltransferase involved in cell wall biosynthesis